MWLLHSSTYELKEFIGRSIPPYAILSHVWDGDEVSFRDMRKNLEAAKQQPTFSKIRNCCEQARKDSLEWVWIDSCCIDKRSSAELSEAINSMFKWYPPAQVCYAFLADVSDGGYDATAGLTDQFSKSRWFTRGWTLQELIASPNVHFFSNGWDFLGTKGSSGDIVFVSKISTITNIGIGFLTGSRLGIASVAERMSWASSRQTTREEDIAYSLMGLFGVSMPILYGEGGERAFERLQIEIIGTIADHSILAWRRDDNDSSGPLAKSPADFAHGRTIAISVGDVSDIRPFSLTNAGLEINLPISTYPKDDNTQIIAKLDCSLKKSIRGKRQQLGICLGLLPGRPNTSIPSFRRCKCNELVPLGSNSSKWKRADMMILMDVHVRHIEDIRTRLLADWLADQLAHRPSVV